ncbi:hypothetical protein [Gemmatimonas phototrophica]|uniref:hypothetical protein n=1 Tax=Gemmatimonas phototrophica TaxID=1379270 RepID=UPI0011AE758A|nr:hypothetical protein [Gemmatimonas phototrophica]
MPQLLARIARTVIVASTFCACIPLPGQRELSSQVVTGKSGEDTLLAGNALCKVGPDAMARVQVGDTHRCIWMRSGNDGAPAAGDPRRAGKGGSPTRPVLPPPQ